MNTLPRIKTPEINSNINSKITLLLWLKYLCVHGCVSLIYSQYTLMYKKVPWQREVRQELQAPFLHAVFQIHS